MNFFLFFKTVLLVFFSYMVYRRIIDKKPILSKPIIFGTYIAFPALTLFLLSAYVIEPLNAVITVIAHGFLASMIEKNEFRRKVFYFGISCAVSYIPFLISTAISSFIMTFIFGIEGLNIWLMILIFAIESIFMLAIYRIKFKTTIDFNRNITSAGTAIAGIVLVVYGIMRNDNETTTDFFLQISGIILCALGLYWWVKKESVDTYNEKLKDSKISKQQEEIWTLNDIRLELEKALHTDSKKLPAYQEAVENLIIQTDNQSVRKKAIRILNEFNAVRVEFSKEITWEVKDELPSTGMALLDAIFRYYIRYYSGIAAKNGIDFELMIDGNINQIIKIITQSQLETLVSNLLDNAVIAVKKSEISNGKIIARLWADGLSIKDNGISFSDSVIADLARCKETLVPDEESGGGIGFVTIFEITNGCSASVEIAKNNEKKSVVVRFDGNNQLVIDSPYKYEFIAHSVREVTPQR